MASTQPIAPAAVRASVPRRVLAPWILGAAGCFSMALGVAGVAPALTWVALGSFAAAAVIPLLGRYSGYSLNGE